MFARLLSLFAVALAATCFVCSAAEAETAETVAEVTILPGPLKLKSPSVVPLHFSQEGLSLTARIPTIVVEDATGSARGWCLLASLGEGKRSTYSIAYEAGISLPMPSSPAWESLGAMTPVGHASSLDLMSSTTVVAARAKRGTGMGIYVYKGGTVNLSSSAGTPHSLALHLRLVPGPAR